MNMRARQTLERSAQPIAQKMIDGGWAIVPIKPHSKIPDGGNGWQNKTFCATDVRPDGGIGIMTGRGVCAIDVDVYDGAVAAAIVAEARAARNASASPPKPSLTACVPISTATPASRSRWAASSALVLQTQ